MADGDQTIVLTSQSVEANKHIAFNEPNGDVWDLVITATFDADDTTDLTLNIPFNGIIRHISLDVQDTTNAITKQVQINNSRNHTLFDTGELANVDADTPYDFDGNYPIVGSMNIVVGVSGAAGATGALIVIGLSGI